MLFQIEIPRQVIIGNNLHLQHRGMGIVVHPMTRIGSNVTLYHQVTIGAAIPWDGGLQKEIDKMGETVRKLRPEPAFTQAIRPKS